MGPEERGLVAPSDIAEMVGVTRAAVSNWRKRAPDFPAPAGGTTSKPLFDRAEVADWLRARGMEPRRDRGESLVWSALNRFRGAWSAEEVADVVLTLACIRKSPAGAAGDPSAWDRLRDAPDGSQWEVASAIAAHREADGWSWQGSLGPRALPGGAGMPGMGPLIDVLGQVAPEDLGAVTDYALGRLDAAQMRSAGAHGVVESRVSALLGRLAARQPKRACQMVCVRGSSIEMRNAHDSDARERPGGVTVGCCGGTAEDRS